MSNEIVTQDAFAVGAVNVGAPSFLRVPYVTFASTKSRSFGDWVRVAPSLRDGDPVMVEDDSDGITLLSPFKFQIVLAQQYWASLTDRNEIIEASFERPDNRDLKEHVETLLFVYLPTRVTPALCTFKTTKCQAIHRANKAIEYVQTPEWAAKGPDYAQTLKLSEPRIRFTATVRTTSHTSRSSGYGYVAADSVIAPTTASELALLQEYLSNPKNADMVSAAKTRFADRIAEAKAKVR